jgi:hypothetical protein
MPDLHTVITNALDGAVPGLPQTVLASAASAVADAVEAHLEADVLPAATLEVTDDGSLLPDQQRRVNALDAACRVLESSGSTGPLTPASRTAPDTMDLVTVARYITDDLAPWQDPAETPEPIQGDAPRVQAGVLYVPDDQVEDFRAGLVGTFSTPAPEVRPLSEVRR